MSSPGFKSGSSFLPGSTEMSMQTDMGNFPNGTSSGKEVSPEQTAARASSGMGALQMAVGFSELRKARRLPFPGYLASKGPLAQMKTLYQSQLRQGIGSEQTANMRMQGAQTLGQQLNAVGQNTSQSSQLLGRTAGLNRTSAELRIANANIAAKQDAMSGIERMNNAMSAIEQKNIAAARNYRITAEKTAGAAIRQGSENVANYIADERSYKRSSQQQEA